MIRAGTYRERVTFQTATTAKDARGEDVTTWTDAFTVYARARQLNGSERERAMQIDAEASWEVRVRYRGDINTECRIQHDTHTLHPVSVIDRDDRHIEIVILAKEHQATNP